MNSAVAGRAGNQPIRYRIVVRGELGTACTGPLEGLTMRSEGGFSVITGEIVDQAQLHGILGWLGALGAELVSLAPEGDPE